MQNKGALKFLAIVLTLACVYQLSFTFVSKNVERKASEYAAGNPDLEQSYLDSMKNEVVYNLGITEFTYSDVKNREINLGLDLKGGMNVMLEISEAEILKALSGNNNDPHFNQALTEARAAQVAGADDFISEFSKSYEKLSSGGKLADIFGTMDLREVVQNNMTNAQVISVLRGQVDDAIANSFNVIRNRIDRFGVTQPNIQRLENTGRILVELPGIKEPERVRKLLQGSASLEFWATYKNAEVFGYLQQANQRLTEVLAGADSLEVSQLDSLATDSIMTEAQIQKLFPLFSILSPMQDPATGSLYGGAIVGISQAADTAKVNTYFAMPQIKSILPRDIKFMWSVKPGVGESYELYAIKADTRDGTAPLDGAAIADARAEYSQTGGAAAEVSMIMNAVGSKTWARLTAENVNNCIAIVLDGYVYSAPNVNGEITGGRSSITGSFTYTEANDLAIVLKSGKLPAPARIVQEAIVGPTLGQESIETGVMSFILAFALVLLYMIAYYNTAGFVANIALIANLFFLFGVLASFGAVLTLPGIAGIVLTMGMAVDANVIIYERIKEEVRAGKVLSMSIADGFKNAYSAIIDGNATTLITGIVLFMFGTGPVQGFATTLIIGIITSLFCAIFITRLVFIAMLNRKVNVKFSNKATENFLTKTKIDFIGVRKKTYVISSVLILVTVVSLFTRGLSLGVDFSGGRAYVVRFDKPVTTDEVRGALISVFDGGLEVKQYGNDNQMRIVTQYRYDDESPEATDEVNAMMYEALVPLYTTSISSAEFMNESVVSSDKVGPSIAQDMRDNAILAVFFSLIAIGLYIIIRFKKWQWAVGGVASLLHDALLVIGVFTLLHGILPFQLDVDQSFIAAILTIIGFSINDTVVIFDRIREYQALYPKRDIKDNINAAINSTLARTINTSGTTFVVLLAMFVFGGEVIRGFVFALMFGVIVGTFSSVFVATPVAYDFMKKKLSK